MAIAELPPALLIYLHKRLKTSHPEVIERIKTFNPWTDGRELDRELGWTFKREHVLEGVNEDGETYRRQTSVLGFVTPDEPAPTSPQLVTLGDSFMCTFYATDPIPWVVRHAVRMPVFNLAVGGWGPDSYREAFEKHAANRNASAVVVVSFSNDITDVDNWRRWKKSGIESSFIDWLWVDAGDQDTVNVINHGDAWLDRNSVVWNLVKFGVTRAYSAAARVTGSAAAAKPIEREVFAAPEGRTFELQLTKGYAFMTLDPDDFLADGEWAKYMEAYFESLLDLRRSIQVAGAKMILIWVPAKERVYLPLLPPDRRGRYVKNKTGRIDGLEVALSRFAEQNGIAYLDLTPLLIERARGGEKLYFTQDGHLNSLGNRVVGEAAARFIREQIARRTES
jgi:hypothetical protein